MLLATAGLAPAATDPKAAAYFEDALTRFEKRDYAGAIVQLKNAIQIDRKQLPVQVLLGRALLANGEVLAAEVAFDEALRLGVNPAEVVVALAEAVSAQGRPQDLLSQARFADQGLPVGVRARLLLTKAAAAGDLGNNREALRLVEEARSLAPNSGDSWRAEVPIRVRARQFAEAKAAAARAVELDPSSPEAAYQHATVAHVTGDLRGAIALYTKTLELAPDHVDSLVARAGIHLDLGNAPAAGADVATARLAAPRDPRASYLGALLAERAGQADQVRKDLIAVTNLLDPFPVEFYRFRPQLLMLGGLSHFGLGQLEKAKPYLELAQRQDGGSPVSKLLAQIYLQEKNVKRGVESLELYLRAHANDTQATMLLASAYMAQGRHGRAAQLMEETLRRGDDVAARSMLGTSLIGTGQFSRAAAELETALKRDPGQLQAGMALAGLYLASGQVDKAISTAQGLVKRAPSNAGLHNLLGSARAAKGDVTGARQAFEQAAKLAPTFLEPQINLARLDIDGKAFDSARKRLEAVLAKDGRNVDASMEMARMFSGLGRAEDSQRWLERAEDHSGTRLQAGLQLVEFHLARRRPDLAAEALKRLQAKAPEVLVVLLTQARVQLANGDNAGARSTLTRATTTAGFDAPALVRIAQLQLQAGQLAGAAHALDKALSERPEHLNARALMAEVEIRQGELAKAEQRARSILASHPTLGLGHALVGDVARARGQLPAAVEAYRRAHQVDRNSESLLRLFAVQAAVDRRAAVALADQWLKDRPGDLTVRRALADAHARAGDLPAARAGYERVVQQAPRDAQALNNLANILILQKDPGALAIAERARAEQPDTPHIIGTLGWAAFHAGQTDRALQLLRDARLRDPQNADARYFLGTVLAQRGRTAEARQELEDALRGGTGFAHARDAQALLGTLK
jgi:putative PEP-CTERM system TPR-repeat lipoprotein